MREIFSDLMRTRGNGSKKPTIVSGSLIPLKVHSDMPDLGLCSLSNMSMSTWEA